LEKKTERLTPRQAKPKIEHYCNYQERCHQEVANKLYEFGLGTDDVNALLSHLVKSNLLNEERFAIAFAGGKFRQKQWGKNKIIRELKMRKVSDYCIKKALLEIDGDHYHKTMEHLAEKYNRTLRDKLPFMRRQKILKHLVGKGYEYELAQEVIDSML
jgi:regulatory protein